MTSKPNDRLSLTGKTALITGGASGIGLGSQGFCSSRGTGLDWGSKRNRFAGSSGST